MTMKKGPINRTEIFVGRWFLDPSFFPPTRVRVTDFVRGWSRAGKSVMTIDASCMDGFVL